MTTEDQDRLDAVLAEYLRRTSESDDILVKARKHAVRVSRVKFSLVAVGSFVSSMLGGGYVAGKLLTNIDRDIKEIRDLVVAESATQSKYEEREARQNDRIATCETREAVLESENSTVKEAMREIQAKAGTLVRGRHE